MGFIHLFVLFCKFYNAMGILHFSIFHVIHEELRLEKHSRGRNVRTDDVQSDVHLEIHPRVLQDIGLLGPLPKKRSKVMQRDGVKRKIDKETSGKIEFPFWNARGYSIAKTLPE